MMSSNDNDGTDNNNDGNDNNNGDNDNDAKMRTTNRTMRDTTTELESLDTMIPTESKTQESQRSQVFAVKFVPFTSTVDLPFWVRYCHLKLETIRLKEDPITVIGSYGGVSITTGVRRGTPRAHYNTTVNTNRLQCQESSLLVPTTHDENETNSGSDTRNDGNSNNGNGTGNSNPNRVVVPNDRVAYPGILIGYNTKEAFQKVDKNKLLKEVQCNDFFFQDTTTKKKDNDDTNEDHEKDNENENKNWKLKVSALNSTTSTSTSLALPSFVLLTFADLKQHKVLYWFGFPALMTKIPIMATIINTPLSSLSSSTLLSTSTSTSTSSKKSNEKKTEQRQQQEEHENGEAGKEKVWWTALAEGLFHHLYLQQQEEGNRRNYLPAYFAVPSSLFPSTSTTSTSSASSSIDTAIITSCVTPHVTDDNDNDTHTHTHLDNDHPDSFPSISSSSPVITKLDIVTPLNHQNYQQMLKNQHQHQHQHQQQHTKQADNDEHENNNNEEQDQQYDVVFGFIDPTSMSSSTSTSHSNTTTTTATTDILLMGWPMRNLIAYLVLHLGLEGKTVQILSLRHGRCPNLRQRPPSRGGRQSQHQQQRETDGAEEEAQQHGVTQVDTDQLRQDSILMKITLPLRTDYDYTTTTTTTMCTTTHSTSPPPSSLPNYKVVGWELNVRNKAGPRSVNLRPLLDKNHLAIQAADLNLKLMKWRMIPELNVKLLQGGSDGGGDTSSSSSSSSSQSEKEQASSSSSSSSSGGLKILLLGAGTLGCSVARTLLGWGIRNFTFVDSGNVNYSNPCRQILFNLKDCHYDAGKGKPKAQAAAEALTKIAADVTSVGIKLSIPMPGHHDHDHTHNHHNNDDAASSSVTSELNQTVEKLDTLIRDCDVVFLLTDTRESRWLPTVMAAVHDKILINAALGLDSWLVMRHGGGDQHQKSQLSSSLSSSSSSRLGCYFCNDVVAPENSTRNRTLDQQCTVTRPGLAPIASSMAVELLISLLHHPQRQRAPAPPIHKNNGDGGGGGNYTTAAAFSPTDTTTNSSSSPLGVIPHQIRGSIVTYTMMIPSVPAFPCCTGCCTPILDAYRDNKFELVARACCSIDGPSFLEHVSGLTQFRAEGAEKLAEMEDSYWDDDDDDDDDEFC